MLGHTLSDTFEFEGSWWLPSDPGHPVRGSLQYMPGEPIRLKLHGSLSTRPSHIVDTDRVEDTDRTHQIILGVTSNGQPCTLVGNYLQSSSWNLSYPDETWAQLYQTYCVFYRAHFATMEEIRFLHLRIRFFELESWMNNGVLPAVREKSEDGLNSVKVAYNTPAPTVIDLPVHNTTIKLSSGFSTRHRDYYALSIHHHNWVIVRPYQAQHWDWFRKVFFDIRNLLTLLVGQPVTPLKIQATVQRESDSNETDPIAPVDIYFRRVAKSSGPMIHPARVLIPFSAIESQVITTFNAWFSAAEQIGPVTDMFFGLLDRDRRDRFEFLGLVQALESFHRSTEDGKYVSEETYKKVWNKLFSNIPTDVYSDVPEHVLPELKQAIKDSTRYSYQYSLRKRLKQLFASLDQPLCNLVCKDSKAFVNRVVDERNFLSHLDKDSRQTEFDEAKLIFLARRLRILLTILLLKRLGIDNKLILEKIKFHLPPWD